MSTESTLAGLSRTIASTATLKLAGIHSHALFYTPLEERFERITRLARRALRVPVAAITVVDGDRQWFKSVAGWLVAELPLERSLCKTTLQGNGLTIIEDAASHAMTADHPLVVSRPNFRFYAGFPLLDESGAVAGTFCVLDVKQRTVGAPDRQSLLDLGAMAQRELLSDYLRDVHRAMTSKLGVARREAMIDPLTRLWNRRGANVLLKAALDEADRGRRPMALALLDLDNFKRINDKYGHQTGDEMLAKLATRLVGSVRADDPVCRLGGDEFMIIMSHADAATAEAMTKRVRERISEELIPTRQGALPASVSIGYVVRPPDQPLTVEQLIDRADDALRRSKLDGRNRVRAAV